MAKLSADGCWRDGLMPANDPFAEIARYYDPIMEHVDYDRWHAQTESLLELLPRGARHLDAGCGTGTLVQLMRNKGYASFGIDLSPAMIQAARKRDTGLPVAVADLRQLPFSGAFHLVTCLFDSLNFLLEDQEVQQAINGLARCLADGGIVFFDVVTERMVLDHFVGPGWLEENGGFRTFWKTVYDRGSRIAETTVQVNQSPPAIIHERVYPLPFLETAIQNAGLHLLDVFDTDTLKAPTDKTTRIDFIAAKAPRARLLKDYKTFRQCLNVIRGKG